MIRVKVSTSFPEWPLERQTPGRRARWGNCEFHINTDVEECDFWAVLEDVPRPEATRCPRSNTIFVTLEPPTIRTYSRHYLAQYATVITCSRDDLSHPNLV